MAMRIDVATHILPTRYFARLQAIPGFFMAKRVKGIPCLFDLDVRFRVMDRFGEYQQVLSLALPSIDRLGPPEATPDLARLANDELAALVAAHPGRFAGAFGGLPMNNPDASLRELERLASHPAFFGVQIHTNVAGHPLDEPPTLQIFEEAARRRMPIFLHPARPASLAEYPAEKRSRYDLWQIFGWPYETTIAMGHLVFTGLFDRHPDAAIITHHFGAMAPHFVGRMNGGFEQYGTRGTEGEVETLPVALAHPPAWYFRRFYADTALFGASHAMRCALAYFPPERVLFGSDTPFDPEGGPRYIRDTIADLDESGISAEHRRLIDEGNFRRLAAERAVARPAS
jgi:predicted TIM-barrel fold metal-dependent hydrolase